MNDGYKKQMQEHITAEQKQFLIEYVELCKKYKMGLKGCGCCGSPSLGYIDNINYDYHTNEVIINDTFEGTINEFFKWLAED